jgi:hypothetical protein
VAVILISALLLSVVLSIGVSLDRARRRVPLREAMKALEVTDASTTHVTGTRRGFEMTYRLTTRPLGDGVEECTEIRGRVPELPFMMDLRPETHGSKLLVERGMAVDLRVGDDDFDRAFLIEAAPADVVQRFLDAELRRGLLELFPVSLKVAGGEVVLERTGWLEHGLQVEAALDLVARAMARLRSAFAEADEHALAKAPQIGAPFRGLPDASAVDAARTAREGEVAALALIRRRRQLAHRPELLYGLVAAVVILAFATLVVLL